jgi:hypothetical protein
MLTPQITASFHYVYYEISPILTIHLLGLQENVRIAINEFLQWWENVVTAVWDMGYSSTWERKPG